MSGSKGDSREGGDGQDLAFAVDCPAGTRCGGLFYSWGQRPLSGVKSPQEVPLAWFSLLVQ